MEHIFSAEAINFMINNTGNLAIKVLNYYKLQLNSDKSIKKITIPTYIQEIKDVIDIEEQLEKNFLPLYTWGTISEKELQSHLNE